MLAATPVEGVQGRVTPGFDPVAHAFAEVLADGGEAGAAFAATHDGELVVDLWGGWADRRKHRRWEADTVAGIFSGSKGLVAVCMLMLLDRGLLELDAPVARYWPEFAAEGKHGVLVRHVVSHTAGLPGVLTPVDATEVLDDRDMAARLALQPPTFPPGERLCYHALTFGWLCGELVRRVDGRSIGRFFAEEVAGPLQLDAWIGLPAEHEPRVATLQFAEDWGAAATPYTDPERANDPLAIAIYRNPPRLEPGATPWRARAWHAAEIPATNAIVSARSLARLYGCLARGGELDGVRLMSGERVAQARACLAHGTDPFLGRPVAYGVGFEIEGPQRPFGRPRDGFGHRGAGGSVHGAWPGLRVGFSFVTNLLRDGVLPDPRGRALLDALYDAVTANAPKGTLA